MKSNNMIQLIPFVLALTFASMSFAKSPVFKVSKGDDHIYIGGTIHLLSESDYPLPTGFTTAFDAAEHVYFETDTSQMSSAEVQAQMGQMMALPEEKSLLTELSKETYARLEAHLNERGLDIAPFHQITPSAVSMSLTVFELQLLNLGNPKSGVDHFFNSKATEVGKKTFYLESLEEQIGFIGKFNSAEPNLIINAGLDDLNNLGKSWKEALAAWREGDLEAMGDRLGGESLQTKFPAIYKVLLTDRNNRWLNDIRTMFDSKEIELILVGALHLTSDDGLIQQLQKDGYTVEQLD